jgi:hypothetical protein
MVARAANVEAQQDLPANGYPEMNWIERWRAISSRILALGEACNFLVQTYQAHNAEHGGLKFVFSEIKDIGDELKRFFSTHRGELPPAAAAYLQEILQRYHELLQPLPTASGPEKIQSVAPLLMIRARFDYLIQDMEIEGRNATELAFEHLRRTIVVDPKVRDSWKKSFDTREEECERLGAVHLLSHGLWAFKVKADGAATDLVYNEPVDAQSPTLRRTARAIVLTEWKRVRPDKTADTMAVEARKQAELYAGGILGDLELKRTRYVVLVTERHLDPPPDIEIRGTTYRHVVIPVTPKTPSQEGRSRRTGGSLEPKAPFSGKEDGVQRRG